MRSDISSMAVRQRRKQRLAILAILLVGLVLGALILRPGDGSVAQDAAGHEHDDHRGHEHDEVQGDAGAAAERQAQEHVTLSDAQIRAAGLVLAQAGPARIRERVRLAGEIRFNEDWTAHVVPRLAGIVESVPVGLGQAVKKGEVLAVLASAALSELRSEWLAAQKRLGLARTTYQREKQLWQEKISAEQDYLQARLDLREAEIAEANARHKLAAVGAEAQTGANLSRYEITAPFDGLVVEKHIAKGEAVREDSSIFTISDLSTVWAEIIVPASALGTVRVGAAATVQAVAFDARAEGKVSFVGALLGQETRTAKAWVVLPNPDMAWRPGLFVNVDLWGAETHADVAVAPAAIQEVDGGPVVFVREPEGFVVQPVTLGRRDTDAVQVLQGLAPGVQYAAEGSFVLKSELGKGTAEHSH